MNSCERHEQARRDHRVSVQDIVEVLDIDEYLKLGAADRRKVDSLLDTIGSRRVSGTNLRALIDIFGSESATALGAVKLLGGKE